MLWFYLILLSLLGTSGANMFRRIAMKYDTSDPIASAIIFQFLGAAIVGCVALWHGFVMPPIAKYPLNVIAQAILWGGATWSLFKASQYLEASESAIIIAGSSLITVIASVIFLHEHFGLLYILGSLFILFPIYLLSSSSKMRINKGTAFALLYCLLAGLGLANDGFMLKFSHSDTLSLLTLGFFAPGVFLLLLKPMSVFKMKTLFHKSYFVTVLLLTVFYAFAAITYFFFIHVGGQASQVSVIDQAGIILTVIFGTLFLGEKDHLKKKILCTILVTIGVVLLS